MSFFSSFEEAQNLVFWETEMPKHVALSIILGVLFALPAWSGEVYTRERAIQIALEKASDIQTAQQDLKAAESKVNEAYGSAYPSVDFSATYARSFGVEDVEYTDINSMLDEQADANDELLADIMSPVLYQMLAYQGFRWGTQVGLTVTQTLYAQGKVTTGIQIAKAYKRVNELALDEAKEDVRYDVEAAFDQVLYLDSSVAIYEASIEQANKHWDYVKKANESGILGELDMIRAQIQVDELTSGLEKTKKNQVLAKNSLLSTMGLPWESDVQFEGTLRDPMQSTLALPDTSMNGMRQRRKDLSQLNESEKMYTLNVDINKGDYLPTVVLGGSLTYDNGANEWNDWDAPDWDENISKKIYLGVSMNLFNGWQTRENVTQAKSDVRNVQIQKETAERSIQLEMESAMNTWNDAQKQIVIQKSKVDLAQRNLDLTQVSYEAGKSPQLDLLDANMSLRTAKLDYMSAVVDWNKAYNALLKATGEY